MIGFVSRSNELSHLGHMLLLLGVVGRLYLFVLISIKPWILESWHADKTVPCVDWGWALIRDGFCRLGVRRGAHIRTKQAAASFGWGKNPWSWIIQILENVFPTDKNTKPLSDWGTAFKFILAVPLDFHNRNDYMPALKNNDACHESIN